MNDTDQSTTTDSKKVKEFLATARERFNRACQEESEIRADAEIDLKFLAGEQWDSKVEADRKEAGRPALTFNKMPTFVQQVANECRQNKPQPKVNPVSGGADQDTAKVFNGLIRHVQYNSKADIAYDTALEYATSCGFGYFRFLTDYCEDENFEQELLVKPVLDPFSIYGVMIPACLGKRLDWAFVVDRITRDDFKRKYPKADATSLNFEGEQYNEAGLWLGEDDVQIAEYWYVEQTRRTLQELSDGQRVYRDEYDKLPPDLTIVREREVFTRVVKQCITNGFEILDQTEWVGDEIPIVPVLGKQLIVKGKVKLFSLIHFLRDPQQLFNYYKSGIAEKIGLNNRVPYVGYEGQFTDRKWSDANVKNYAYLEAAPVMIGGQIAPLPIRQQLEEQIQALSIAAAQESDDMKAIAGIFDASLGAAGNETSGIAIGRRQQQSSITNLHFGDNLTRAEWAGCLIMIDLIPKIYNEPGRQVRIVGEDEAHSVVVVNQPYQDEGGKQRSYLLARGKYDVVVTTGPSYTTARQEGADTLSQVFKAVPQAFQFLGDLWMGQLDFNWSEEAARRFKKTLPPELQQDDENQMKVPPQVQQQLQQSGQMIEQLTAAVHQLQNEIDMKKVEMDSRERIAALQEETKRAIALATIDQKDGIAVLEAELATVKHSLDLLHQVHSQAADQAHQAEMQQQQQAAAAEAAQQQQEAAEPQQEAT